MTENTYQSGNTVRLTCVFKDLTGTEIDPDSVMVIIYDPKYQQISSNIIPSSNKTSTGNYYFDYTVPSDQKKIYYEWYGEINGVPSLKRGGLKITFI